MTDPVATATPIQGTILRTHGTSGGTLAAGGVVAMFGTFGGLAIGVLLTLAIGAAVTFGNVGRVAERRIDPVVPGEISEVRLMELLKAEREAHQRGMRELAEKYEALRQNVSLWQDYCEKTRCHCRHPGVPGSPGAVGAALMESAPPKVDKP